MFPSPCTLNAYYLKDNAICASLLLGLSNEGYFLVIFEKFFLVPALHFFRKCGFRVTLQKIAITRPYLCDSGTFGAAFCAKIVSSLSTLSAVSYTHLTLPTNREV